MIREQRNTRKRGGDIRRQDIFNRILSIGYEMETTQLAKFTLLQGTGQGEAGQGEAGSGQGRAGPGQGEGQGTLLHTDLAANDLAMVQKLPADNVRRQEILTLPLPGSALPRPGSALPGSALPGSALPRPGSALPSDDAFSFLVTNDMAETNLTRYLQKVCEDPLEAAVAVENAACLAEAAEAAEASEAAEADEIEEECDARVAAVAEDYKNALYTFRTEAGVVHPIQFVYRDPRPCGQFSDVEWVGTFLRPAPRKTLILDTFVTFLGALLRHLDTLTATPGTLMLNFSGTDQEAVLHPRTRMLFRAPDTNLHYMQIQYKEPGRAQAQNTINDVKIKPQMTFSCQAMYVIPILAEMVKPFSLKGPGSDDSPKTTMRHRLVKAVDDVVTAVHALTDNRDMWPAEGKRPTGKDLATFQGYLWLFIFKIVRYYGYVAKVSGDKGKEGAKYFKDALFFNSRHSNAQLYQAMKAFLAERYAWSIDDPRTAEALQRLLLQPEVWEGLAAGLQQQARKKAFDMSNDLPPTHPHYGDPRYSLKSYLQFFDAPAPMSVLSPVEDAKMRDWLYYAKVDIYSSQMAIEDHRILVEVRFFAELVAEAFPEVLSRGTTSPTVAQLKECVAHYNAAKKTRGGRRRRTRRNRR